jgi:hypothetical protein
MFTNLTLPRAFLTSIRHFDLVIILDEELGITMFSTARSNTLSGAWLWSIKMAAYYIANPNQQKETNAQSLSA